MRKKYHLLSHLILLAGITAVLAGCRSERVAFQFQPPPQQVPAKTEIPPQPSSVPPLAAPRSAATASQAGPRRVQAPAVSSGPLLERPAQHRRAQPTTNAPASYAKHKTRLRVARRHPAAARPLTTSGENGVILALGLIGVLGGGICLLVSLFILSGTLALVGLGTLALGILLFWAGWGSGYAFG